MDAGAARLVKDVLQEKVRGGSTVMMTTHILEIAERMADRIGVIAQGRLIAEGTLAELRDAHRPRGATLEDMFLSFVDEDRARGMNAIASLVWFARHERRLAWRDALSMMTAGRPDRERRAWIWLVARSPSRCMSSPICWCAISSPRKCIADLTTLIAVTASILLSGSAMLSQAMESVTRTFYSRSDLELILSAPVKAERLFAVRIGAMALSAADAVDPFDRALSSMC